MVLFIQSTYKNCLSCDVAPFSFKSTKEDSIVVVSVMACTRLASSRHNRRLSDDTLFHRSSVVSRYRPLWRNRYRPASHGPPPLFYQPVLVKYPCVEPELTAEVHRHPKMAAAKAKDLQRAFAVCCIRCPCPYLHAWVIFHRLYGYLSEGFNDWGGRGCDDFVPGEVTKTAPSRDRTTLSPTWSASLPRIQRI